MSHCAKYQDADAARELGHYDRSFRGKKEHIDDSRTKLNYNLAETDQSQPAKQFLENRVAEIGKKRKDAVVMCDWVVTEPKDLPAEKSKEFFQHTYNFLKEKYGKENIVSANVHCDETTNHMHFAFVPCMIDEKGQEKLCAKKLINRKELRKFHPDLEKYLKLKMGYDIHILNDETREGNKSIEELRRRSAAEKLKSIELQEVESKNYADEIEKVKKHMLRKSGFLSGEHIEMSVKAATRLLQISRRAAKVLEERNTLDSNTKQLRDEIRLLKDENTKTLAENIKLNTSTEAYRNAPPKIKAEIDKYIKNVQASRRAYARDLHRACAYDYAIRKDAAETAKKFKNELNEIGVLESKSTYVKSCYHAAAKQAKSKHPPQQPIRTGGADGWGGINPSRTDYSQEQETKVPSLQIRSLDVASEMQKDWNMMTIFERAERADKNLKKSI